PRRLCHCRFVYTSIGTSLAPQSSHAPTESAERWHGKSLLNGERLWGAVLSVVSTRKDPAMLVLSRRLNEKIVFPESNTVVQVVGVKPGVVRLGVRAPAEVTVLREEVHDR